MTNALPDGSDIEIPAEAKPSSGQMDVHGATHVGLQRQTNEDQFLIAELTKSMRVHQTSLGLDHQTRLFGGSQGKLLLVADGMGGHEAGERASMLAVDSIATYALNTMRWFFRLQEDDDEDFQDELKEALGHCQATLRAEMEAIPQRQGMGTTLTMAYLIWPRVYVVHVGDSRCYLFRNSILKKITRDHTMAQLFKEQLDAAVTGEPAPDAEQSQWSNVLWNVLGGESNELSPEVYRADLQLGDTLLLCTDGLTKHVNVEQIAEHLKTDRSAEEICHALIDAANAGGGTDNVTVVVARFREKTEELLAEAAAATQLNEAGDSLADTDPYVVTEMQPEAEIAGRVRQRC